MKRATIVKYRAQSVKSTKSTKSVDNKKAANASKEEKDEDHKEEDDHHHEHEEKNSSEIKIQHKFEKVSFTTYKAILKEYSDTCLNMAEKEISESALVDKGLQNYLAAIETNVLNSRIMYGFAKKRSSGKIKFF